MKKHSKRKIVVVSAGEDISRKKLLEYCRNADLIISADAGLNVLDKLKIKPSIIIGDMDSANEKLLKKFKDVQKELFPTNKDLTDSELALKKALLFDPEIISIFGATGSYFDHSYANVINLFKYHKKNAEIEIITSNARIFSIVGEKEILNHKNRRFSLFVIEEVHGLEMHGSKYEFKSNKKLSPAEYSISNVIINNDFKIKFKKGLMFCVLFDEGYK